MALYIRDNEATAVRRRVPLFVYADTAGGEWAASTVGVKVRLSLNGGSESDTTADITRVAGVLHYVELTQAEVNRAPGDRLFLRLPAASGRMTAFAIVEIGADDIFAAAATTPEISTALLADFADVDGAAARAAIGEQAALTVIGAADLRYDDTTGSALTVVRKSTSATVATVPLRRGDRTQPIIGNG